MQGKLIEVTLHELHIKEVPRHIQVHAAPAEARVVLDLHARDGEWLGGSDFAGAECLGREQLAQRLHAVEQSGGLRRPDDDALRRHLQAIAFLAQRAIRLRSR